MSEPEGGGPRTGGKFDSDYYSRVYSAKGVTPLDIHWWANQYYARLGRRLLRRAGGNRVLDVGCGQGFTLARFGPSVDLWGLEVSEFAAAKCRLYAPTARIVQGNIEEGIPEELPRGGFDLVLARYVLEHLQDPAVAIRRCASLIRPGGYFLFAVPNTASPGRRLKGDQWFGLLDETHCSLLDPPQWRDLVGAAGLRMEKVFSDGLWDVPYMRGIPRVAQYGVFSIPTILAVLFASTALPLSWGENLIAYARKPS